MSTRNSMFALIFLVGVLAFMIFAVKQLLFRPVPAQRGVAASLDKAKPVAKPSQPKPSAAVSAQPSSAPSSSTTSSSPATSSQPQTQAATSSAGAATTASTKAPSRAVTSAAPATKDHVPQLRLQAGVRLWIRVTAINRKPDGSFTFHGALLQPVALANSNQLDQGAALAGSGTVSNGHTRVLISGFTVGGANYALQEASGSGKRPGAGLAVELDPGKLIEVWLASSSVYRKTP